jgi:hypothetical protein
MPMLQSLLNPAHSNTWVLALCQWYRCRCHITVVVCCAAMVQGVVAMVTLLWCRSCYYGEVAGTMVNSDGFNDSFPLFSLRRSVRQEESFRIVSSFVGSVESPAAVNRIMECTVLS